MYNDARVMETTTSTTTTRKQAAAVKLKSGQAHEPSFPKPVGALIRDFPRRGRDEAYSMLDAPDVLATSPPASLDLFLPAQRRGECILQSLMLPCAYVRQDASRGARAEALRALTLPADQ